MHFKLLKTSFFQLLKSPEWGIFLGDEEVMYLGEGEGVVPDPDSRELIIPCSSPILWFLRPKSSWNLPNQ